MTSVPVGVDRGRVSMAAWPESNITCHYRGKLTDLLPVASFNAENCSPGGPT
jgi:hypothetical protein